MTPHLAHIGFWDLWKAISVALTGLFGIIGLLTTYKDKDTGRMTVWGRINLAAIVLSATMGVASQLIDAQNKATSAQAAAISAAEAAATASTTADEAKVAAQSASQSAANTKVLIGNLLNVSRRTETIARGTEHSVANSRAAAHASEQAASRTLGVARGTAQAVVASQAGLVRIERLLSPFDDPVLYLSIDKSTETLAPCPPSASKATVSVIIMSKDAYDPDIIYSGDDTSRSSHDTTCTFKIPLTIDQNLGFSSYLDLPGKVIYINVGISGINLADYKLSDVVRIYTRNNQKLDLLMWQGAMETKKDTWFLTYSFPPDRDPRPRRRP